MRNLPTPMTDGSWVSENVARIAELIREYDPRLDVRWIPPDKRQFGDDAFVIVETTADGQEFPAFYVKDESFFDHRLLTMIYEGDNANGNVYDRLEAKNKAQRDIERKAQQDAMEEANDYARFLIKTPLHRVNAGKGRKIDL